jgi:hypothetical protein
MPSEFTPDILIVLSLDSPNRVLWLSGPENLDALGRMLQQTMLRIPIRY